MHKFHQFSQNVRSQLDVVLQGRSARACVHSTQDLTSVRPKTHFPSKFLRLCFRNVRLHWTRGDLASRPPPPHFRRILRPWVKLEFGVAHSSPFPPPPLPQGESEPELGWTPPPSLPVPAPPQFLRSVVLHSLRSCGHKLHSFVETCNVGVLSRNVGTM